MPTACSLPGAEIARRAPRTHLVSPTIVALALLRRRGGALHPERGAPSTPAAWIADATRPDEQVVTGTLDDLAAKVEGTPGDRPALLVVGEVVALRERLVRPSGGSR